MKSFNFLILLMFSIIIVSNALGQAQTVRLARVSRVIDGDTFVLSNGERVRLLGVDTPELTSKDSTEQYLAHAALAITRGMIDGKIVKLACEPFSSLPRGRTQEGVIDIFGRTLAYVFILNQQGKDSLFVQVELLKSGLARILMYPKNRFYYHLFYNLRNTARKKHLGVWNK